MDPAQLREHGEWLRRLARSLARGSDGSEADDLVQEAMLAALRSPPDADRPFRPWIAEVLRNAWRMRRRGDSRRREREVAAAGLGEDHAPAADALLERATALSQLSVLLGELPEALRTTVLLRYGEGLSAARIAELQGLSPGTVRWRLKAGLDRLRAGLDERQGRERWKKAVLLPFTPPKSATALGALAMKKWLVLALALLLVGAGLLTYSRWRTPGAKSAAGPALASTAGDGPPAGGSAAPALAAPGGADRVALADPARAATVENDPSPTGVIEGRVINWSTGQGVAGAELSFAVGAGTMTVQSAADGGFELIPPGPAVLATASATGFLPYAPEWGTSPVRVSGRPGLRVRGAIVFLFPALDYQGVVVDPDGKPVAGAKITQFANPSGDDAIDPLAGQLVSDKDGRFVFHAADGAVFEARARGFGPGRAWLSEAVSISRQMTIRLAANGEHRELASRTLAGHVLDEAGQPVVGARVRADAVPGPGSEALPAPPVFAETGSDGRFELPGLDPLTYDLEASHDEHAPARQRVLAGKRDVKLTLVAGGSLVGHVREPSGAPVAAFTVLVLVKDGLHKRLVDSRSVVDAEGRFDFAHLPAGDFLVSAAARGFAPSAPMAVRVVAGQAASAELHVPRGGTIVGRVSGDQAAPLTWARVMVETGGGGATIAPANAGTVTGENGEFRLTGVAPGSTTLSIGAADHHPRLVSGLEVVDGRELGPLAVELRPLAAGETPQLELVGIGVKLRASEDGLLIDAVIEGGGAAAAGLAVGDEIISVDGASVEALGIDGAIGKIRGVEGSLVRVGIERAGVRSEVAVERRKLRA